MMTFTRSRQSWILLLSLSAAIAQTPAPIASTPGPITSSPAVTGPTVTPVYAPVLSPSVSPVGTTPGPASPAPTSAVNATDTPSDRPSDVPSGAPTLKPTSKQTSPPSVAPVSDAPSDHPSSLPSKLITDPPSFPPSAQPTKRPSPRPTKSPTKSPTSKPTRTSNAPTAAPIAGTRVTEDVENISITFLGALEQMNLDQLNRWQNLTADWFQGYFNSRRRRLVEKDSIADVSTQLTVTSQNFTAANAAQGITQNAYQLTYTQRLSYIALNGSGTADQYIDMPFQNSQANDEYAQLLRDQISTIFEFLISPIMTPEIENNNNDDSGTEGNPESKNDWLTPGVIAGIAIGGAAIVLLGACLVARSLRGGNDGYTEPGALPPQSFSVNAAEDISTIDDPTIGKVGSGEMFGDQSVNTVDYDYTRAYGGGGEASVVSSAGGTMGENTRQTTCDITSSAARVALGASSADYDAPYHRDSSNIKEEVLEIIAPAGKLGVVIDTPDDGAPVVHAVKDSSVIADQIQVGDKLIAVDDEDVRSMTAIKVSKLISRKSANPSRKLTVIRSTVMEPDT